MKLYLLTILSAISLMFTACEKVIDVDLAPAAARIVIEGNVSDQTGPYTVTLTKTADFNDPNRFDKLSGALVTLSDNAGNAEVLTESSPGIYKTNTFTGVAGRDYTLKVVSGSVEYAATSSMGKPVAIEEIAVKDLELPGDTVKMLNVKFTDPSQDKNFYRLVEIVNGDTLHAINVTNDEFQDGKRITYPLIDDDIDLKQGDVVTILLLSIDEKIFDYMVGVWNIEDGRGSESAAPANPPSNFNNNALGYFSAHAITSKTIVIP